MSNARPRHSNADDVLSKAASFLKKKGSIKDGMPQSVSKTTFSADLDVSSQDHEQFDSSMSFEQFMERHKQKQALDADEDGSEADEHHAHKKSPIRIPTSMPSELPKQTSDKNGSDDSSGSVEIDISIGGATESGAEREHSHHVDDEQTDIEVEYSTDQDTVVTLSDSSGDDGTDLSIEVVNSIPSVRKQKDARVEPTGCQSVSEWVVTPSRTQDLLAFDDSSAALRDGEIIIDDENDALEQDYEQYVMENDGHSPRDMPASSVEENYAEHQEDDDESYNDQYSNEDFDADALIIDTPPLSARHRSNIAPGTRRPRARARAKQPRRTKQSKKTKHIQDEHYQHGANTLPPPMCMNGSGYPRVGANGNCCGFYAPPHYPQYFASPMFPQFEPTYSKPHGLAMRMMTYSRATLPNPANFAHQFHGTRGSSSSTVQVEEEPDINLEATADLFYKQLNIVLSNIDQIRTRFHSTQCRAQESCRCLSRLNNSQTT